MSLCLEHGRLQNERIGRADGEGADRLTLLLAPHHSQEELSGPISQLLGVWHHCYKYSGDPNGPEIATISQIGFTRALPHFDFV